MSTKPTTCKLCPLFDSPGPVWGTGPKDAKIMIVGEAPGEDEESVLRPFVGGSGRVLTSLLAHAGVNRADVFLTNTVRCRPTAKGAGGRTINRVPTDEEIRCCAPLLIAELEEVKPNVILALGNVPLHTLTDTPTKRGILLARSVPTDGPRRRARNVDDPERYKVISTIHPAGVMRQQHLWPAVVFDIVRTKAESSFAEIRRRAWKRVIHAYLPDVADALMRRIKSPRLHGLRYYHHDLETTGGIDPRTNSIRCIGLAAEADEVFCFDWTDGVKRFVAELHADESLLTVGQNSEGFDIPFQEAKGLDFAGPSYDTMIGFHLLNSALPKDLGFIGASVTDELFWKDETMYKAGEDALHIGCCKDVHATARAFEDQIQELDQLGQYDLYFNHIMPLQPVLRAMTKRGLRKDAKVAAGWHIVLNRKADELEARLKKGLGDVTFNVDSPKQLMDLLYTRMSLPVQYVNDRKKGLRPSVDAEALDRLATLSDNPLLLLIRSIRTLRKWDSTFVLCPQDENGFVHARFGSAKAATGRLNSWEPNMQNWPSEIREIIVPDDGDCILMSRDWSGIEWRIAMTLSGDKVGLDAIAAGRDPHKDSYAQAFSREYDGVTKRERDIAKSINYGLLYGRGIDSLIEGKSTHGGLASEGALSKDVAEAYKNAFLRTFSGYDDFRKYIQQFVAKHHYFATAWGRRRWWFTRDQLPEAYNFPMQGNAASMMYVALIDLERQLPVGATLRASVHDECVLNVHKDVARQAEECMLDVMEQRFPLIEQASLHPDVVHHYYPTGWYVPSEGHVGLSWRDCKPETEEQETKELALRKRLGLRTE